MLVPVLELRKLNTNCSYKNYSYRESLIKVNENLMQEYIIYIVLVTMAGFIVSRLSASLITPGIAWVLTKLKSDMSVSDAIRLHDWIVHLSVAAIGLVCDLLIL